MAKNHANNHFLNKICNIFMSFKIVFELRKMINVSRYCHSKRLENRSRKNCNVPIFLLQPSVKAYLFGKISKFLKIVLRKFQIVAWSCKHGNIFEMLLYLIRHIKSRPQRMILEPTTSTHFLSKVLSTSIFKHFLVFFYFMQFLRYWKQLLDISKIS